LNSEPQNIEQEISNDEVWNRFAQSFLKNNNDRIPYFDIHYSLFDIRYSLFAFSKFLSRLNWPLFRPAAALIPFVPRTQSIFSIRNPQSKIRNRKTRTPQHATRTPECAALIN
jgi:hypothetical protein